MAQFTQSPVTMLSNALLWKLYTLFTMLDGVHGGIMEKQEGIMIDMLPDAGDVNAVLLMKTKSSTLLSCLHQCLANQDCQYVAFCVAAAICLLYQASVYSGSVLLPNGCQKFYKMDRMLKPEVANRAIGKACTQSSTYWIGKCERAIDGNPNPDFVGGRSCTHTLPEVNPWWRVDLGRSYAVISVTVANRNSQKQRLDNYDIRVGNSLAEQGNLNEKCVSGVQYDPELVRTFQCVPCPLTGRYVNVQIINPGGRLSLCEVIVMGL